MITKQSRGQTFRTSRAFCFLFVNVLPADRRDAEVDLILGAEKRRIWVTPLFVKNCTLRGEAGRKRLAPSSATGAGHSAADGESAERDGEAAGVLGGGPAHALRGYRFTRSHRQAKLAEAKTALSANRPIGHDSLDGGAYEGLVPRVLNRSQSLLFGVVHMPCALTRGRIGTRDNRNAAGAAELVVQEVH